MNRTIAVLLLCFCLHVSELYSQPTVEINDIASFSFGNLQAVTDSTGVLGYSCCYEVADKAVDGKRYLVKVFDKNLEETDSWSFTCNSKENLLATAFNGSDFMTIINDSKKKILYHKLYNTTSKREMQFEDKLDANSQYYLEKHLPSDLSLPGVKKMLYPFGSADFVSIIPTKHNNVFTYDVNIFSKKNGCQKVLFTPETNAKTQQASFIGNTEDLLLFYVFSKKDLTNNKYESNLVGIDIAFGKQQFAVSTKEGDAPYLPLKAAYQPGQKNFTVLGNYFKENGRVKSDKFKGLCLIRMNEAGQIEAKNILDWKENFGKNAKAEPAENDNEEDSAAGEIKNFQVQAFNQATDGSLYIVGEGYHYHTEPGVMAAKLLLGGAGGMLGGLAASAIPNNPFMVTDMVMIHADNDLKIDSIARFDKKEHHATEFDTDFSMTLPAQNQFVIGYRDYNLGKIKEEFSEKLLVYGSGAPTLTQNSIFTKAINYQVLPASGNEVLLVEYFAKRYQAVFSIKTLQR